MGSPKKSGNSCLQSAWPPSSSRTHWEWSTCTFLLLSSLSQHNTEKTNIQINTVGDHSAMSLQASVQTCVWANLCAEWNRGVCLLVESISKMECISWTNHSWALSATLTPHINSCQQMTQKDAIVCIILKRASPWKWAHMHGDMCSSEGPLFHSSTYLSCGKKTQV